MKSFLSLATALTILFSFQAAQAAGPTYVRDNITVPTVWSAVNSPYVIQNDIVVAKGAVLTIEPGVQVRFVANKGGKVVSVQLHGRDDSGGSWASDKTDVDPQTPSEAGWTLEVHQTLDLYEGKGGNRQLACSVYVNAVEFVPAE